MFREIILFLFELTDLFSDNFLISGLVFILSYFFGPSFLVYLERKNLLRRIFVWIYFILFVPFMFVFMLLLMNPQTYCNDPLPHDIFRWFYVLILPLIPFYLHYVRSDKIQHPYIYGVMIIILSVGVFSMTFGYEIFHLTYQTIEGQGVVYSGARAWECAYLNSTSESQARITQLLGSVTFTAISILSLILARKNKRQNLETSETE